MKQCRVSKGSPSVSPFLLLLAAAAAVMACNQREKTALDPHATLRDDLGSLVSLSPPPRRVISLAPSITETLFALGADSLVAGVTDYCDFPPEAKKRPSVGGLTSPSFEQIASLNPDLILMSVAGNSRADHDKLVELGFRVFVTNPSNVEGVFTSIRNIGILTRTTGNADTLIAVMQREQNRLKEEAQERPARDVLMLLSLKPIIAVGGDTFLQEILSLANSRNLAANAPTSYPLFSREHVLGLQPEVILVMDDAVESEGDFQKAFPEWKDLDAMRNNRVVLLESNLVSRPGPRIMLGLRQIVTALR